MRTRSPIPTPTRAPCACASDWLTPSRWAARIRGPSRWITPPPSARDRRWSARPARSPAKPWSHKIHYNLKAEYGLSSFDQRNKFTGDYLWELPFGHEKRWLSGSGIGRDVLGDWQWSGDWTIASGFPFTPRILGSFTNVNSGVNGTLRPDLTGEPVSLSNPGIAEWFNAGAFVVPPLGQYGNAGRNSIEGPGEVNFDMAMTKVFPLKENRFFEVRMSATNVFNHPELHRHRYGCELTNLRTSHLGRRDAHRADDGQVQVLETRMTQNCKLRAAHKLMALVIAAGLLCPNLGLAQQTGYTFKAEAELVLVNVSVRDRDGNLVRDLKPEDFTILEDNKPQKVSSFDIENMQNTPTVADAASEPVEYPAEESDRRACESASLVGASAGHQGPAAHHPVL